MAYIEHRRSLFLLPSSPSWCPSERDEGKPPVSHMMMNTHRTLLQGSRPPSPGDGKGGGARRLLEGCSFRPHAGEQRKLGTGHPPRRSEITAASKMASCFQSSRRFAKLSCSPPGIFRNRLRSPLDHARGIAADGRGPNANNGGDQFAPRGHGGLLRTVPPRLQRVASGSGGARSGLLAATCPSFVLALAADAGTAVARCV